MYRRGILHLIPGRPETIGKNTIDNGSAVLVGGSMGPTGHLFEPLGSHADAVAAYAEQARGLVEGGVDVPRHVARCAGGGANKKARRSFDPGFFLLKMACNGQIERRITWRPDQRGVQGPGSAGRSAAGPTAGLR